jgi:hypothetical protein
MRGAIISTAASLHYGLPLDRLGLILKKLSWGGVLSLRLNIRC